MEKKEQKHPQDFREDLAKLIEAGFIAVKQLDEISASRIFHAAQLIAPDSTAPRIGLGFIALNKLEIKKAVQIFSGVVADEPENYLAKTFLGVCYLFSKSKRPQGEAIIRDAMEKSDDPTVKELGTTSLEWAKKDLSQKKEKPFLGEKAKRSPAESSAMK